MSTPPRFSTQVTFANAYGHKKSLSLPILRKPSVPYLSLPSASPMSLPLSTRPSPLRPPKYKRRAIFLAILAFAIFILYFFFRSSFFDSISVKNGPLNMEQALETLRAQQHHKPHFTGHREQVHLDAAQELAAVSSFLASLPHNVIPSFVDPSLPIDPQLVLDFDTRGSRAEQEVQAMVVGVWARNPVFLYSKMRSSISREVKSILSNLNLYPPPTIIDVDIRDDVHVLLPLLSRLTGHRELPVLIVGGQLIGPLSNIRALEKSSELHSMITASGAVIGGAKRKKHRNH
ncbi:hypothetical protein APHAL10511_003647 [Amanita phalloides]|nr:hypothetical protein APHAL10511_003647 [Amanita phalloides]